MQPATQQRPAALTKADFTLKGVKTFRGIENEQYEATLYCQGKPLAHLFDDGWGGCLRVDYKSKEAEKIVTDFCATLPPMICEFIDKETGQPAQIKIDIDLFAGELMDEYYEQKEAKRFAKLALTNTLFKLKGDRPGEWRSLTYKGKLTDPVTKIVREVSHDHAKAVEAIKRKYADKLVGFYEGNHRL